MVIRPVLLSDAQAIANIYNYYILETCITFEEVPVTTAEMSQRIEGIARLGYPWLVAEEREIYRQSDQQSDQQSDRQNKRDEEKNSICEPEEGIEGEGAERSSPVRILGYAYAGKFRDRAAFRHTVETAVYLDRHTCGRGVGRQLYRVLIDQLIAEQTHRVIAGISLPNQPSVKLHESFGFKQVAAFNQIGFKFQQWIDVGFWELKLK